jgi:hypothetical protein
VDFIIIFYTPKKGDEMGVSKDKKKLKKKNKKKNLKYYFLKIINNIKEEFATIEKEYKRKSFRNIFNIKHKKRFNINFKENNKDNFNWDEYIKEANRLAKERERTKRKKSQEALREVEKTLEYRKQLEEERKAKLEKNRVKKGDEESKRRNKVSEKEMKIRNEIHQLNKELKRYDNFFGMSEEGKKILASIKRFFKEVFVKIKESGINDELIIKRKLEEEKKRGTSKKKESVFKKITNFLAKKIQEHSKNKKTATEFELEDTKPMEQKGQKIEYLTNKQKTREQNVEKQNVEKQNVEEQNTRKNHHTKKRMGMNTGSFDNLFK